MVRAARGEARKNIPLLYFFWIPLVPKHPETKTASAVSVAGWEQHSAGAFPKAVICTLSRWPTFACPNPLNVRLRLHHILHTGSCSKDNKIQLYEFSWKIVFGNVFWGSSNEKFAWINYELCSLDQMILLIYVCSQWLLEAYLVTWNKCWDTSGEQPD